MLRDNYQIRGDFKKGKRVVTANMGKFLKWFSTFYQSLQKGKSPDLLHEYCDPYGFAMLCNHYYISQHIDLTKTCKENFNKNSGDDYSDLIANFSFEELLNILHRGYWFDKKLAMDVFNAQQSPLSIFKQITAGQGFVQNRYRYDKPRIRRYMNYALESKISLDEDYPIPKPYIHRVCDGMVWPCIVTKYEGTPKLETLDLHGWGNGLFLITDNNIVDVLRINDLWLTDTPLENRLKFIHKVKTDFDGAYVKTWNWRDALNAGKLLEADSSNGILVRSCHENYLNNRWFVWNKTSCVYCYNINNILRSSGRGRAQADFYTLEGDLAYLSPFEEKKVERVWLDDFDIKEFQKILELK